MNDGRRRELTAAGLWAAAAVSWVVAMLVPWFRVGVVGSTTPMEVAGLLRSGVLDVPPAAGYAVLAPPAIALVLLVIAPLRGGPAMAARVVLWLVGTAIGVLLVVLLARVSDYAVGPGAVLVVLGCVLGGVAMGFATVRVPTEDSGSPGSPGSSSVW